MGGWSVENYPPQDLVVYLPVIPELKVKTQENQSSKPASASLSYKQQSLKKYKQDKNKIIIIINQAFSHLLSWGPKSHPCTVPKAA